MLASLALAAAIAVALALAGALLLHGKAPARANSRPKAFLGFFWPLFLVVWAGLALLGAPGPEGWAFIWFGVGIAALVLGYVLAAGAPPKKPTHREEVVVERRGEPLDPVFIMYSFAGLVAVLAAVVTRHLM